MVDLSRIMQDAAILEVIDKSADEASNLSAQNSYQAMRIEELEAENAKLRNALAEIREVWAGSEQGEPIYASEAYAVRLCKQQYQIACDALKEPEK